MKPDPAEFLQKELFGSNNITRLSLQNNTFFSENSNGETAFIFIYHSVLKKAKNYAEQKKNENFINFISENDYDEYIINDFISFLKTWK